MISGEHKKILLEACIGDEDAFNFLFSLGRVFRVWDDLWDQDRRHGKEEYDNVFSDLAFEMNQNPFYRLHRDALEAQIFVAWNAWQDANIWEDSEDHQKRQCAWYIRDYCNEMVPLVAWLLGGKDHAREISLKSRTLYLKDLIDSDKEEKYGILQ